VTDIIAEEVNGSITYNGHHSVYAALWEGEAEFRQQDFGTQMSVVLEVMIELAGLTPHVPKEFAYRFVKTTNLISCLVLDKDDKIIMNYSGAELPPFMNSVLDLEGVRAFLVSLDKIHPEDKITFGNRSKS